jgi:phosphate transport system substrate-binding protein
VYKKTTLASPYLASSRLLAVPARWLTAIVIVLGLWQPLSPAQSVVLVGVGSSVPLPLYTKWAQEYNQRGPKFQMRYLALGTSEGINQVAHGSGDFGAGEVPLDAKQRTAGKLTEVPAAIIGIVPIYNLPSVHGELRLSGELLAGIFLGRVKTWNSPAMAKLNPGISLPNLPIQVIYRPAGKGSNYVFSEFLSKTSAQFRSEIGISPSPKWPVGVPAERSSDMAEKVKSEPGSIGYVELQYAVDMHVPYGLVQSPSGAFVKASTKTITAACEAVESPRWDRFAASLTDAPGPDSYPITSFTWIYVPAESRDSSRAAAMTDLLQWMFSDGQRIAVDLNYSALPPALLNKVRAKVSTLH